MRLIAKRKQVLNCIESYDCYKLCVGLMVLGFIMLYVAIIIWLKEIAAMVPAALILWVILFLVCVGYGIIKTIYFLKGLVAGSKMYVSVSSCYLQYIKESGLFVCRQINSAGEVQYMEIYKNDIDWVLPDKYPGFYVHICKKELTETTSEISTRKQIAYILATGYEINEFKELYLAVSEGVVIRNAGREETWGWPVKGKELKACLLVWAVYCIPFLWACLCIYASLSAALTMFLSATILGIMIWRGNEKNKGLDSGNTAVDT